MIISGKLNDWHGMDEKRGPLKMLRTKGLAQAQSTRLYILLLVIQDHIESIGKANTIKKG